MKATYHFAAVQPTSEILCNRLLNLTFVAIAVIKKIRLLVVEKYLFAEAASPFLAHVILTVLAAAFLVENRKVFLLGLDDPI